MLTVKEAAIKTGYCEESIRRFIRSGDLKAIKLPHGKNGEYRIKESDIASIHKSKRNVKEVINGNQIEYTPTLKPYNGTVTKKIRESMGVSVSELANMIGATRQTIYNYENGKDTYRPTGIAICCALDFVIRDKNNFFSEEIIRSLKLV